MLDDSIDRFEGSDGKEVDFAVVSGDACDAWGPKFELLISVGVELPREMHKRVAVSLDPIRHIHAVNLVG